jgi:hypothetical protein
MNQDDSILTSHEFGVWDVISVWSKIANRSTAMEKRLYQPRTTSLGFTEEENSFRSRNSKGEIAIMSEKQCGEFLPDTTGKISGLHELTDLRTKKFPA